MTFSGSQQHFNLSIAKLVKALFFSCFLSDAHIVFFLFGYFDGKAGPGKQKARQVCRAEFGVM